MQKKHCLENTEQDRIQMSLIILSLLIILHGAVRLTLYMKTKKLKKRHGRKQRRNPKKRGIHNDVGGATVKWTTATKQYTE